MNTEGEKLYVQPALTKHELLRDITATRSGGHGGGGGYNGGYGGGYNGGYGGWLKKLFHGHNDRW
jgi:hypothetical protein